MVTACHVLAANHSFDLWFETSQLGRGAVLVFFMISGYVIGLSNPRLFAAGVTANYWRRRFVRLAPLYGLVVVLGLLVMHLQGDRPTVTEVFGPLLLLQNFETYCGFSVPPPSINTPLWALHHEIVYYALFLVVWCWRPSVWLACSVCLGISLLGCFAPFGWQFIGSYATGFCFWLTGLWLAWRRPAAPPDAQPFPFIGLICLMLAVEYLRPARLVLAALGVGSPQLPFVSPTDFALWPICFLLLAGATGTLPCKLAPWTTASVLPAVGASLAVVATNHSLTEPRWFWGVVFTLLGALFILRPIGSSLLGKFGWFGGISYALYLVHMPVVNIVNIKGANFSSLLDFPLRISAAVILSVTVAALLEYRIQPPVARWLNYLLTSSSPPRQT